MRLLCLVGIHKFADNVWTPIGHADVFMWKCDRCPAVRWRHE